jgi:hypothetical protein
MPRQKPQRLGPTQPFEQVRRKAETDKRAAEYAERTKVKLVRWAPSEIIDENKTVPPGTEGWTTSVDDRGTVWVDWENGATLGVTTDDEIEAVPVCSTCGGTGTDYVGEAVPMPVTCEDCGGSGKPKPKKRKGKE